MRPPRVIACREANATGEREKGGREGGRKTGGGSFFRQGNNLVLVEQRSRSIGSERGEEEARFLGAGHARLKKNSSLL